MSRLASVCTLALLALWCGAAAAQVEFGQAEAQGPTLRVTETSREAVTVEVVARWRMPLAQAATQSDGLVDALVALGVAGRPVVSHEIGLSAAVPPAVQVLAVEADEVALTPAQVDAFGALAGPAASVVSVGERRRELVGSLSIRTLRVEGDRLVRVRRVVVRVPRPPVAARLAARGDGNPHLAVERSALADGTWYKVPIRESGVYRIDQAFLRDSLGIATPPALASVAVYGIGGRVLPALNRAPRPADLDPVASLVVGDGLLFYAQGPQWWDWTTPEGSASPRWSHDISPFSTVSHYFLRVDAPAPARLGAAAFPDWADAAPLAAVADRRFYEVDLVNIERDGSGSGLDWLGPRLAPGGGPLTVLRETVAGAVPASPVSVRARVAAQALPAVTVTVSNESGPVLDSASPRAVSTGGSNTGNLANDAFLAAETTLGSGLGLSFRAQGGGAGAEAWLDWAEAVIQHPATASPDGYASFPTPGGQAGRFEIGIDGFAAEPQVWDVTDADAVRRLGVRADAGRWRVQLEAFDPDRPREVVAFDPAGAHVLTPGAGTLVANQNLHGLAGFPSYVVVTHPDFRAQAERLAAHRQSDGLAPLVVTTDQVFNEFAGGTGDMRAVRDFMKFLYDRAPAGQLPQYLLLFGDGHYDYRQIKTTAQSYVPVYESEDMFSRTASYTSDDYFGLLGDDEGVWPFSFEGTRERVDLGIGRIPARTTADAATVVEKIVRYESPATHGDWRTRFTFVADDQFPNSWDDDLHVLNADVTAERAQTADPSVTLQKVYAPSYPSVVTARGRLRPQATEAVRQSVEEGTLVWNYSGHGGPTGLGDEEYLTEDLVASLDNADRLPVWVTATCSFGKFDIADFQSLAERLLLRAGGGGVAMLTTVRLVYTSSSPDSGNNFGLNIELTEQMLVRDDAGRPSRLGDALYRTKNTAVGASTNNRKFNLLGDPAMRLGLPERGLAVTAPASLQAFSEATVTGQVLGLDGQPDPTYRGEVDVTVFDAQRVVELPEGACCYTDGQYLDRTDRIYSGRASVDGGRFSTTFLVPQDVSYSGLPARVVAYASAPDGPDGAGETTEAMVSAEAGARPNDQAGPTISLFLGDSTFVDGGTAQPEDVLIARLQDESGINTVGAGVGHELLLTIDGDARSAIDVGRFYTGDLDTYRSGTVRVPLPRLAPGEHTATLTAWDALNNASTATVRFVVVDEGVLVRSVLPYPNPTAGPARFFVDHNQPVGTSASVQLRIYTLAGRPIRTIEGAEALPDGFLPSHQFQIAWDGRDDDDDRLGSGVYLVRLRMEVSDPAGGTRVAERVDRLAIIR